MARRVMEQTALGKEGIHIDPLGRPKSVTVLKEVKLHATFRGVFSFQFNYTGDLLAVGFGSGGIHTHESATGKRLKELVACRQGGFSVMALRFHPKRTNELYAGSTDGTIVMIDVDTGQRLGVIEEVGNEINTLDFALDGFNFATGGRDFGVRVYDTKTRAVVQHYKGNSNSRVVSTDKDTVHNTMRIFALKYHPSNEHIFVTGGWDNHLKIWDARSSDGIKRNISGPHICGDAIDMRAQDSTVILSGQWAALHALQEFDYSKGKIAKELKYPHVDGAFLYCAQYCNDNLVVAGGSGTNRAELIEISSNEHVGGFDLGSPVQAIDTTKNGRLIAVGGATSSFYILQVSD